MSINFVVKRNDTLTIGGTLNDAENTNFNLIGATVTFKMRHKLTHYIAVNASATILDPTLRTVQYNGTVADTVLSGEYEGEFQVVFSDNTVATFPSNKDGTRNFINILVSDDV